MKYLCKVYATPMAFIIIQFREGIQHSGQFATSVGRWEPGKLTETGASFEISMVELLTLVSWALENQVE